MDAEPRYALNDGAVAKIIEREAIVLNVASGRYFDLEGPAAVAWALLAAGAPLDAVVAGVTDRFAADDAVVRADVERFVAELSEAELLVPAAPGGLVEVNGALDAFGAPPAEREPYHPISLAMFDDLEDLLAFDPPLPAGQRSDGEWSPG